ncbi:UNVERIFIED_CONTAM: hypothetical protein Sradi_6951400 [Sesamum radiatum]|uniref:DUF4283 domain-containing protein n=1 Tax=Sesamum radiatum TaxID=300843 RepID=A0AAW2JFT3_SESRA
MTKLGDEKLTTPVLGLKPVASRRPTPFQPPVRELRRPIRNLIPADSPLPPPPLLTMSAGADDLGAYVEATPLTAELGAPSPRVLGGREEPMQIRVSSRGGAAIPVEEDNPPRPAAAEPPPGLHASPIAADEVPLTTEDDTVTGDDGEARPTRDMDELVTHQATRPRSSEMMTEETAARKLPTAPAELIPAPATTSMASFFVGNVPIHSNSFHVDTITDAFHNSSRKTLSYIPPTLQNGETVVRPSLDTIRNGAQRWATTAVGYFLGKRPYFHHVNAFARSVWPLVREVKATANGFFFFEFKSVAAMEEVIEGGPWLFHGQAIVLQKWEPGMVLRKLQHTQVPVWIKLRHLPVELWTTEGLSIVASGVGKPLYPDAITRACTRLDFARVCVMLDISAKLLTHIVIMIPKEDGSEMACKVDVEYEWLPPKCTACHSLGHPTKECPTTKPKQPPVNVYVQKPTVQPQTHREQRQPTRTGQQPREPRPTHGEDEAGNIASGIHEDKGKAIVLYNAFDKLLELDSDDATIQETRVAVGNVARVQRGLLPQWTYYVDYGGPGNRVWLAWDTEIVDVTVVETGAKFIHCTVFFRSMHLSAYRALLSSLIYHLWREHNIRVFQLTPRTTDEIARIVVTEIRDLIICKQLPRTVSTRGPL